MKEKITEIKYNILILQINMHYFMYIIYVCVVSRGKNIKNVAHYVLSSHRLY